MPGHLFIVQGDLTRLACDAWLLPTGRSLQIRGHWLRGAPDSLMKLARGDDWYPGADQSRTSWRFAGLGSTPPGWFGDSERTFDLVEWGTEENRHRPWPTRVVADRDLTTVQQARWIAGGARQFVEHAAKKLQGHAPAYRRHRHLLGLPVVGTGAGGGWHAAGEILRELVRVLTDAATRLDVDVALVAWTRDQLAAAHQARRELLSHDSNDPWSQLADPLRKVAQSLADRNIRRELVLFLGAGVSVSAGLPSWTQLLDELATDADLEAPTREALKYLPPVDQARYIRDRLEKTGSLDDSPSRPLAEAVCSKLTADRYGLTHALLANLSVTESVTTNYDTLFELASESAGYRTSVLPYGTIQSSDRWLLKMHGCVEHPEDIVLTREDYLRYSERRGALAGIVQALLVTRHMLFVGFSLSDDNFQRIADEVRKVIRGSSTTRQRNEPQPFGTALLLDPSPLLEQLWRADITCVTVSGDHATGDPSDKRSVADSVAGAAAQLEIMLDHVLYEANRNVSHLLDWRYDGLLSDSEQMLRKLLTDLQDGATDDVRRLQAWAPVAEMLEALGGENELRM